MLESPLLIGLIVLALVLVALIVVILRRRRASKNANTLAPPDLGQPIDYTSITVEEPVSLADRFRSASPVVKGLLVLAPLILIGALIALAMSFSNPGPTASNATPQPAYMIEIARAEVAGNGKIVVVGTTNLPRSSTIVATMKQGDQEFVWFNPDTASTQVVDGKISLTLDRSSAASVPDPNQTYTIGLSASIDGKQISSGETPLTVLTPYRKDFYQVAEVVPTKVAPTAAPTNVAPTATPKLTAVAIGGGKVRQEPSVQGAELGQVTKGETLTLLERTQDGAWYRVSSKAGEGWVSSTLLEVAPDVAASVPTSQTAAALTTTVFNGGNVRPGPGTSFNPPLDQINAGETVQLLAKSDDGTWFQIKNIRGVTGWVNRTLLNLSVELIREVPVAGAANATPVPATGLTAVVANGGNVRPGPGTSFSPALDQINARETVELLAKNEAGTWYQIKNIRGVTGWVSASLLTIDPAVEAKLPVAK